MTPATPSSLGGCFFPFQKNPSVAVEMTAVLWNDQSLLGCWVDTKWQSSTYQIVAKTQQNVHFWRTSKWFFCIRNWTSKKGEKWFLGQGGLGVHQQANMVLMEENPNNHLGCMKTLVNDGIFTVKFIEMNQEKKIIGVKQKSSAISPTHLT